MPDVLQTLGNTNWLLIVATKILEIGWMLRKTSTGGNLIWTTSSTSAGFECKLNFVYIFCNLFTFHFFFTPVPNGARHFFGVQARLDSTQPCMPHWAACYRHRGNVKHFHIYITVCRNVEIQGALTTINPDPWQLLPMKVGPSGGKNFQGCCPKNFYGRPTRIRPQGFQCKTRLSHRWSGNNAK